MKILGGVHAQNEGNIIVDGTDCGIITPQKAVDIGIGFVHQELNLAEALSVAENVFIGRLPYKNKLLNIVDFKKLNDDTKKILDKLGIDINPNEIVNTLSTANKQMIEIAKAISLNAKIIILMSLNIIIRKGC
jgi:ribose transport system ATP-binding protein